MTPCNSDIFRDLIFYNHILYCLLLFPIFNSWHFVLKWQSLTGLFLKIFLNMEISWEISKTVLHIKRCISWLYLSPRFFLYCFFINWYILLNHHHFITYGFFYFYTVSFKFVIILTRYKDKTRRQTKKTPIWVILSSKRNVDKQFQSQTICTCNLSITLF